MIVRPAFCQLGPPRIKRDSEPVKLDRRKVIALVAFLAATGESQRRDTLVNLLWPQYDSSQGRESTSLRARSAWEDRLVPTRCLCLA